MSCPNTLLKVLISITNIDSEHPEKLVNKTNNGSGLIPDIPLSDSNLFDDHDKRPPLEIPGMEFVQSMPHYCTRINRPIKYVTNGAVQQLSISMKPKPRRLDFWVTGFVSK